MPEIEFGSAMCRASALPRVLVLSLQIFVYKISGMEMERNILTYWESGHKPNKKVGKDIPSSGKKKEQGQV